MRCLSTGLGVALGWPWGGLGWLRATSFLVSAFSISAFQLLPKGGFDVALMCLARPVTHHASRITSGLPAQSRITNHESPPALGGSARLFKVRGSRFEVQSSVFRSQDQTGLNAKTQRNAEKRRENEVSADLVGAVVPNERAVLENALTD